MCARETFETLHYKVGVGICRQPYHVTTLVPSIHGGNVSSSCGSTNTESKTEPNCEMTETQDFPLFEIEGCRDRIEWTVHRIAPTDTPLTIAADGRRPLVPVSLDDGLVEVILNRIIGDTKRT